MTGRTFCAHCWEWIDESAPWPDHGTFYDGLHLHEGCVEPYRLERAEAHVERG